MRRVLATFLARCARAAAADGRARLTLRATLTSRNLTELPTLARWARAEPGERALGSALDGEIWRRWISGLDLHLSMLALGPA